MKVIFLDFNGILDTYENMDVIDSDNLNRLKRIVDECNAKVVLTTSNKNNYYRSGMIRGILKYIIDSLLEAGIDVIGMVPMLDSREDEMALKDISFKVSKGQTLAIIGSTGSAKTTLINLIPRFYDVSKGEVLVNGVNVKDYNEKDLRKKISVASQKAVLFKGSIKDNITYGANYFDQEKLNKSITISHSKFIEKLEDGVNSEVAQGGTNFSGGQKQRISIARAVYKDAEIMIFDDTFSALDYKTDMQVRKAIKKHLSDKTIIIVAQRIGTIKDSDQILVLDEGKIVGKGTHSELLEKCKIYKEIALSQLSKEEL